MADSKKDLFRLVWKLSALTLAAILSYLTLLSFRFRDPNEHTYLAAHFDKVELLKRTPSPRLVLLGGSNLAFGVDSRALGEAFRLPVVNMGLHAGLGLRYILDSATSLLRRDDVVVVVPEYEQFVGDIFDGNVELLQLFLVTHDPAIGLCLSPWTLLKANAAIFSWSPARAAGGEEFPYTRDGFNRYGDEVSHLTVLNVPFQHLGMSENLNRTAVKHLAKFMEERKREGVWTVFLLPCLMKRFYEVNRPTISRIDAELKRRIRQVRSMTPDESVYDDRYFFDTHYHLNADGIKRRTAQMIEMLNRAAEEGFWRQPGVSR